MITCIAIDDEPLALNVIRNYVQDTPQLELLDSFTDPLAAIELVKKSNVDVLFLDINMPNLSGISFVKSIVSPPLVVFTTAYPEYAVEGFELEAIDYLLKPFSFPRFLKAVNKITDKLENRSQEEIDFIFIKSDKKHFRLLFSDIKYLEAYGDYVKIHTNDKMLLTKQKLTNIYTSLPNSVFIQIHRKYIVSLNAIDYLEGNMVNINGMSLPISNSFRNDLFEKLKK